VNTLQNAIPTSNDLVGIFSDVPPQGTTATATRTYDSRQRRRKVHTYYETFRTNLLQHVLSTADLNEQDAARIVTVFGANIDSYSGPESKSTFRAGFKVWSKEWCTRYATLTATVTPLLPALTRLAQSIPGLLGDDYRLVTDRLLSNLHQYPGHVQDTAAFADWAAEWVTREVRNCIALAKWIEVHQGIVHHGLLEILADCKDLVYDGLVDELASEVWHWVSLHVNELLEPGAPLHLRLRARAVDTAHGWKTQRLRDGIKYVTNFEPLEDAPDKKEDIDDRTCNRTVCRVQY
jgi:hypothetical protein